jgi:hypothetical protein
MGLCKQWFDHFLCGSQLEHNDTLTVYVQWIHLQAIGRLHAAQTLLDFAKEKVIFQGLLVCDSYFSSFYHNWRTCEHSTQDHFKECVIEDACDDGAPSSIYPAVLEEADSVMSVPDEQATSWANAYADFLKAKDFVRM